MMHGFEHTMRLKPMDRKALSLNYRGNHRHAKMMRRLKKQVSADGKTLGVTTKDIKDALMTVLEYGQ